MLLKVSPDTKPFTIYAPLVPFVTGRLRSVIAVFFEIGGTVVTVTVASIGVILPGRRLESFCEPSSGVVVGSYCTKPVSTAERVQVSAFTSV